jgi:hypothetical protein
MVLQAVVGDDDVDLGVRGAQRSRRGNAVAAVGWSRCDATAARPTAATNRC